MSPRKLIVVTGPSHSGKSSLRRLLVERLDRPVASVDMDGLLADVLVAPAEADVAAAIEPAHDVFHAVVEKLLAGGWSVVAESTFTRVGEDDATFYAEHAAALADAARRHGALPVFLRLAAELPTVRARRERTGRLSDRIVRTIWELHSQTGDWPQPALELDAERQTPEALADHALARIDSERSGDGLDLAAPP